MKFSKKIFSLILAGTISFSSVGTVFVNEKTNATEIFEINDKQLDNYIIILKDNSEIESFIFKLNSLNIKVEEIFDTVFKGVLVKLNKNNISHVEKFEEVSKISKEKIYKDFDVNKNKGKKRKKRDLESLKIIGKERISQEYDGRGMAVAVIDSGADINHPDFRLDDGVETKISEETVSDLIKQKKIFGGKYVNEKIPFIKNYTSLDTTDVRDVKAESHGMHVAGIVAANPIEKNNKSIGVVPNAQLVLMKVFADNGSTQTRYYVNAIKDAIKLNVDSINMSLGSGAGSVLFEDEAVKLAIQSAKEKGITVAIAGGNDGFYSWGIENPDVNYPDYGVTSTPGVLPDSLTVASVENSKIFVNFFDIENNPNKIIYYKLNNLDKVNDLDDFYENYREVYFAGLGKIEDFTEDDLSDKIVLIKRGDIPFSEKIKNAKKHGAKFVVFYNQASQGNIIEDIEVGDEAVVSTLITNSEGEYLKNLQSVKIKLSREVGSVDSPVSGKISNFSSWGVTSDGDLKPDITAPGGNIYSTINDRSYTNMSGTSMASPHVSGVIAIVNKRILKDFPEITADKKQQFVKNILMNTAIPHKAENGEFSSPRQQGAGVINVERALNSKAIVYGQSGIGSINLGSIQKNKINLNLTFENLTNQELNYTAKVYFTTDNVENDKFNLLPKDLGEEDFGSYTISPKEKKQIKKEINISNLQFPETPNGNYLDGFIIFKSTSDSEVEISVPFTAFVGDFANLKVIEPTIYELLKNNKKPIFLDEAATEENYNGDEHDYGAPLYKFTHLYTSENNKIQVLGKNIGLTPNKYYTDEHIAISPNGDGIRDYIGFKAKFLRNYKDMSVSVEKDGEIVFLSNNFNRGFYGLKSFYSNGANLFENNTDSKWIWNGIVSNTKKAAEDGKYLYKVKLKPVVSGAIEQILEIPFVVDTVAPEIKFSNFDANSRVFKIKEFSEDLSGIRKVTGYYIKDKQETKIEVIKNEKDGKIEYSMVIPQEVDLSTAFVKVEDWAGNFYNYPISESVVGEKVQLIVRATTNTEDEPPQYEVNVYDLQNIKVDAKNLNKGQTYRVEIQFNDPNFELEENIFEITPTEENPTVIVNKVFKKVEFIPVNVYVYDTFIDSSQNSIKYPGEIKIKLINTKTNEEFILSKNQNQALLDNVYSTSVKEGEYKIIAENVVEDWNVDFDSKSYTTTFIDNKFVAKKQKGYTNEISIRANYKKIEPIKFYLQEIADSNYKDYAKKPIKFVFTNIITKQSFEHSYSGIQSSEFALKEGKYKVTLKDMPNWNLEVLGTEDNIFNVVKQGGFFSNLTLRFKLTSTTNTDNIPDENQIEPKVKIKFVYLQPGYLNEYKNYNELTPIVFKFKNKNTGEITIHNYSGEKDFKVELKYGTYEVISEVEGYTFKLDVVKNNTIIIGDDTTGYESAIFIFKKNKEEIQDEDTGENSDTTVKETRELWIEESYKNQYKGFGKENPIIFKIKNKKTLETITHNYTGLKDFKVGKLFEFGEYEISAEVEGYDFKVDVVSGNTIEINGLTNHHESVIFLFTKKEKLGENSKNEESNQNENSENTDDNTDDNLINIDTNINSDISNGELPQIFIIPKIVEKENNKIIYMKNNQKWEKTSSNNWVFIDENNERLKSVWIKDGNYWFRINENGILIENTLFELNKDRFIALKGGYILEKNWKKIDSDWYYAKNGGYLATNEWFFQNGKWYWFDLNSKMSSNGWIYYKDKWYYSQSNGEIFTSGWKYINKKWYHFEKNGELSVSTKIGKYFVNENGEWIK